MVRQVAVGRADLADANPLAVFGREGTGERRQGGGGQKRAAIHGIQCMGSGRVWAIDFPWLAGVLRKELNFLVVIRRLLH
jgi:hypothetical protein